jgi:hypothetical protein
MRACRVLEARCLKPCCVAPLRRVVDLNCGTLRRSTDAPDGSGSGGPKAFLAARKRRVSFDLVWQSDDLHIQVIDIAKLIAAVHRRGTHRTHITALTFKTKHRNLAREAVSWCTMASRGGRPWASTAPFGRCSTSTIRAASFRQMYLPTPVVFTTGVADAGDYYTDAADEVDLACRITHMPKALFA